VCLPRAAPTTHHPPTYRYDKVKILLKEIQSCQYVACMNPTAGSFNITPRMQRHFATFAVQMPPADIVRSIYLQIMDGHLAAGGFEPDVARLAGRLVDATIELHRLVMHNFLPSAVKFHYQFNLRETSNIVNNLCRMHKDVYKQPVQVCWRVWRAGGGGGGVGGSGDAQMAPAPCL
jgi:dynein heavy chain